MVNDSLDILSKSSRERPHPLRSKGNIFSGIINISGDFTATSLSLMNASYKGFKDTSQPAIDKFMDKCQQALDKNTNNINK